MWWRKLQNKSYGEGIEGPSGTIPSTRIVQWFKGGGTELNKTKAALGAGGGGAGGAVIGGIATCWKLLGVFLE